MQKENWDTWKDTDSKPIEVRKTRSDQLWHVVYFFGKTLTYDRVTKEVAMKVIGKYLS